MTLNRNLNRNSELSPEREGNVMMEQNPSKKTELMSVKGTDVKHN